VRHIDQFLGEFYASQPDTSYTGSTGFPISTSTNPEIIEFDFTTVFGEDSTVFPSQSDLDAVIQQALESPAADELVAQLNLLPASNPFSNTVAVEYDVLSFFLPFLTRRPSPPIAFSVTAHHPTPTPAASPSETTVNDSSTLVDQLGSKEENDSSTSSTGLVVIAIFGIVLGFIGLAILEVRRIRRAREEVSRKPATSQYRDESEDLMSLQEETVSSGMADMIPTWSMTDYGVASRRVPSWSRTTPEESQPHSNLDSYSSLHTDARSPK